MCHAWAEALVAEMWQESAQTKSQKKLTIEELADGCCQIAANLSEGCELYWVRSRCSVPHK